VLCSFVFVCNSFFVLFFCFYILGILCDFVLCASFLFFFFFFCFLICFFIFYTLVFFFFFFFFFFFKNCWMDVAVN